MSEQIVPMYRNEAKLRAELAKLRARRKVPDCAEDRVCQTKVPGCRCYYCVSAELQKLIVEKWAGIP